MKERPILFNAPVVRAILDGGKTQTRRPMKKLPWFDPAGNRWHIGDLEFNTEAEAMAALPLVSPYGQPGGRLWVRETWNKFDAWQGYFYAADDHPVGIGEADDPDHIEPHDIRWKPSIHMPRAASRITLEITSVRVERSNDCSEADAVAEGWPADDSDPRQWYAALWEQINGSESWAVNPWVWVVEFRRIR